MSCCMRLPGGVVCSPGTGSERFSSGGVVGGAGFVALGGSFGAGWLPGRSADGVLAGWPDLPAFGDLPGWLPGRSIFGVAGFSVGVAGCCMRLPG